MSLSREPVVRRSLRHELDALRADWIWFLVLGISLLVLGTIAIGASVAVTMVTVILYGILLIISGVAQSLGAFWTREWSGFFFQLLTGVLSFVVGILFVRDPGDAALAMTLLLACYLLVSGCFKIVAAATHRFASWAWPLASGVIDVALGIMIWARWPLDGLWVIGLFVGINMLMNGWTWIMLALGLRSLPRAAA